MSAHTDAALSSLNAAVEATDSTIAGGHLEAAKIHALLDIADALRGAKPAARGPRQAANFRCTVSDDCTARSHLLACPKAGGTH